MARLRHHKSSTSDIISIITQVVAALTAIAGLIRVIFF